MSGNDNSLVADCYRMQADTLIREVGERLTKIRNINTAIGLDLRNRMALQDLCCTITDLASEPPHKDAA
jgi:hypothetical protein